MSFDMDLDFQNNSQQDYQYIFYEEIQDVADYQEINIQSKIKKRVRKTKLDKKRQSQHRKQSTNIKPQCLNISSFQCQQYSQEAVQELSCIFGQMNLSGDHHQMNHFLNQQANI